MSETPWTWRVLDPDGNVVQFSTEPLIAQQASDTDAEASDGSD